MTEQEMIAQAGIVDEDVYEYRRQKEIKQRKVSNEMRAADTSIKRSVRTSIGWVDLYFYYPAERTSDVVVFNFHGGGFCLGYWELDIPYCRQMADASGAVVVNVDYPLAPEYKYPLMYTVTFEALAYVWAHPEEFDVKAERFMVCGSSAGANMSAALVQLAQRPESEVKICGLMMNYPELRNQLEGRDAIDPEKAIAPLRMMQYMAWQFADLAQMHEGLTSQLNCDPSIVWPDTLINAAGYDSLKPETDEFVEMLQARGTHVEYTVYPEAEHGFTHSDLREYRADDAADAWAHIARFIAEH